MEIQERDQDQSSQEKRNAPTVTKEKWRSHAMQKLARGYVLIVGTNRRTANFYQPGKGYEMCAYNVATQLIKEGIVVKSSEHHLGDVYTLTEAPVLKAAPVAPKPKPLPEPVDDLDTLINDLADEHEDNHDDDLDDDDF